MCSTDRIPGATKIGSYWAIPVDAEKPKDERIKSGKYVKEYNSITYSIYCFDKGESPWQL